MHDDTQVTRVGEVDRPMADVVGVHDEIRPCASAQSALPAATLGLSAPDAMLNGWPNVYRASSSAVVDITADGWNTRKQSARRRSAVPLGTRSIDLITRRSWVQIPPPPPM